jgi:hypothetical protein
VLSAGMLEAYPNGFDHGRLEDDVMMCWNTDLD